MNIPELFLAAPEVLGIRFITGEVIQGRTVVYEAEAGDMNWEGSPRVYHADGSPKGILVGPNGTDILLFDTFVADAVQADLINTAGTDAPSNALFDQLSDWTVTIDGQTVQIDDLYRKTKVIESADTGDWPDFGFVQEHVIHLHLETPLSDGATITINPPGDKFETLTATIDTSKTRSDSIHVNQNGFDPDHPQKVAFLSTWLGNNTAMAEIADNPDASIVYSEETAFYLVNSDTGERAFEGVIELYRPKSEFSNFAYNYAQADTYVMDFSSFTEEGNFHIQVDGIGTSYEFEISDAAWQNAFELSMRGFYHQRSGIALEEPFTDWVRPRSLHPEDGQIVYQSTARLMDTNFGYDESRPDAFAALVAGKTDEVVSEAWGGWHDAGDWDRRAQHLDAVNQMLETFSLNPAYFEKIDLNLPESSNAIPDVIDEALWTIDMFMRLQKADGGVPGGIEHEAHPKDGEASWNNSLETFVYAPDPWSSFKFAASAAKAAVLVEPYDSGRAADYLDAAERAAEWALDNTDAPRQNDRAYLDAHNLAAIELYAATGDPRWHDEFLVTSSFAQDQTLNWDAHQTDAAFAYWQLDPSLTNPEVRARIEADILNEAWAYVYGWGDHGPFGETVNPWAPVGWGEGANTPTRAADLLVRAHIITGEQVYLDAIIDETHFGLGANPDNISYTTGIGDEQLREILVEDAVALGSEMPPGITIYGIQDPLRYGTGFWTALLDSATYPASPFNWPVYETWNGFFYSIPLTEFTVDQGMANSAYVWGYLAQHTNDVPVGSEPSVISGTANDDTLIGDNLDNTIQGEAGNDTLYGGDGDDTLSGNDGNDWLYGWDGADILNGGNDTDALFGEAGDDIAYGGSGGDSLDGGYGNDSLYGDDGVDWLYGGFGNDELFGGADGDALFGQEDDDTLHGGDGDDSLDGGSGIDTLYGDAGIDWLYGGDGNDLLDGGSETDALFGEAGNDTLYGGAGGDSVDGGIGDDSLFGDAGIDWLYGGAGADTLHGGDDGDVLFGDADNDVLYGDAGGDSLDGGDGNDVLIGGLGIDILFGGSGSDEFRFNTIDEGGDLIRDFTSGEDLINLASGAFNFGYTGALSASDFTAGAGLPSQLTGAGPLLYFETESRGLWYDPTGGDTADIQLISGFENVLLSASDISLFDPAMQINPTAPLSNEASSSVETEPAAAATNATEAQHSPTPAEPVFDLRGQASVLNGGASDDHLFGRDKDDELFGHEGDDELHGGSGNDVLSCGDGDDIAYGGKGHDVLEGGLGNDLLYGGRDNDVLDGGEGDDIVYGGKGRDTIVIGPGNDTVSGGRGYDVFVFSEGIGIATITDFHHRESVQFDGVSLTGVDYINDDVFLTLSDGGSVILEDVHFGNRVPDWLSVTALDAI